jgi:hypothetical protein
MRSMSLAIRRHAGPGGVLIAALAAALLAGNASGCGLEGDDVVLQRSALDVAYPDALYVLGAVSSARLSGKIDRTLGLDAPTRPEESRRALLRISFALWQLRARLAGTAPAAAPALSIVLLEPMLWSRITAEEGVLRLAVHVDGPARGDVVAVTEEPVIVAINRGTLSARDALSLGLLRLYGNPSEVKSVRAWLQRSGVQRASPDAKSARARFE